MSPKIEVVRPGIFATVQDLGRPGLAAIGVGRSGAADRGSLRLANRLVGNPEENAALEVALGGLVLRFSSSATVAVTGAPCPITAGGRAVGPHSPVFVRAGEDLVLGVATGGLRCYVAVRGGIDVPPVLGARATDTLGGLGPPALSAGTTLPVGRRVLDHPGVDLAPVPALPDEPVLRVSPGPRLPWFTHGALSTLVSSAFVATPDADRVGGSGAFAGA